MKKIFAGCALAALATSSAYAQSTGSTAIEQTPEIVVTGTRATSGVGGVIIPDVPKTRSIITQEQISRASAGQSILQVINQIPGVNYTNSDPYGSSGGNLRIRGFPGNRIAFLWDGLPLNDTGNYAIFGNQTMDSELIDQVSVNLGTTDVDSPTPSAAGGVVSYKTILPTADFGAFAQGSIGDFHYGRISAMVNTGEIGNTGIRGFVQASDQHYNKFRGPGTLLKDQFNFRLYKSLASNGDFISIAGHYNRNRNVFYNNGLASDFAANRYFDYNAQCGRDPATAGVADNDGAATTTNTTVPGVAPSLCTNYYQLRINPSNTANLRGSMRYTLSDHFILTVDPGYQYTLANGGGTAVVQENDTRLRGASTLAGVDLNGDGDRLDSVRLYTPNTTRTNRYTLLSSLIWQVSDSQRLRVAYTFDRGEHRQTGQYGYIDLSGKPLDVFGGKHDLNARVVTADGLALNGRNRYSIAMLNQISGEYFGKFLNDKLTLTAGLRAPFFERKLNQLCYTANTQAATLFGGTLASGGTSVTSGNPYCTTSAVGVPATAIAPFKKTIKYHPLLPSAGVSFDPIQSTSVYASYGRNFSAPSTDNLYRSPTINPKGETTNAYEAGLRYRSRIVQAQVSAYYTDYKNRIVSATDADPASPTFGTSIDRNVGSASAKGFDGQIAVQPIRQLVLSSFLSYTKTKIDNDIVGAGGAVLVYTGGKQFVETPKWQYGGRAEVNLDPFSVAASVKHVGTRYSTDDNGRGAGGVQLGSIAGIQGVIAGDGHTSGYTTVDLDGRVNLGKFGLGRTYLSVSVINLFDKYYFGNISTTNTLAAGPRYSVGAPRTVQGTIRVGF
ncbi:TonB-dependent receptor [Sphingomonas bacterium]|uniref:TonB-dependent receptor n=1 Tax=Sphingomonas bacterium TaxID=1895847 RepID=UPI0015776372|nr:TonB-dependent receptor [Sphingomonas bacterium]